MRQIYFNSGVRRFLENSLIHLPRQRCDLFHIMQISANLGAVRQGDNFDCSQHRIQRPGGGGGGGKKHEIYVAAFCGHLFYDLFVQGWGGGA